MLDHSAGIRDGRNNALYMKFILNTYVVLLCNVPVTHFNEVAIHIFSVLLETDLVLINNKSLLQ